MEQALHSTSEWSPDEAVQQLVAGELLDQPDAHHPVLAVVRRPLDVHNIVQGRRQLQHKKYIVVTIKIFLRIRIIFSENVSSCLPYKASNLMKEKTFHCFASVNRS